MSWEPLKPIMPRKVPRRFTAFMLGLSRPNRFADYRFFIQGVPSLMDPWTKSWWREGQHVSVSMGRSEHVGKLRITKDDKGPFELKATKHRKGDRIGVHVPAPKGLTPLDKKLVPINPSNGDNFVVLDLPDWAQKGENTVPFAGPVRASA